MRVWYLSPTRSTPMSDEVACWEAEAQDATSSFHEGDNRRSGGEALSAFMDPIEDRNLCVGPLYLGPKGEYAGGVFTQVGETVMKGDWAQLRLPKAQVRKSVGLAMRPGQGASRFAIVASNDGSVFTELLRTEADAWPLGRLVLYPIPNATKYRYYRLILLQGQEGCNGYLCVHRVKFFQ